MDKNENELMNKLYDSSNMSELEIVLKCFIENNSCCGKHWTWEMMIANRLPYVSFLYEHLYFRHCAKLSYRIEHDGNWNKLEIKHSLPIVRKTCAKDIYSEINFFDFLILSLFAK